MTAISRGSLSRRRNHARAERERLVEHSRVRARGSQAAATRCCHAGREDLARLGVHAPPLDLSSTYSFHDLEAAEQAFDAFERGDLARGRAAAGGVPVLVDNTFATPVLQNPAALGAELVLHSATTYLGGHGDGVGGVVATSKTWGRGLRRVRILTGAVMHPLAAYLLHRGLPSSGSASKPRNGAPGCSRPVWRSTTRSRESARDAVPCG